MVRFAPIAGKEKQNKAAGTDVKSIAANGTAFSEPPFIFSASLVLSKSCSCRFPDRAGKGIRKK